MDMNKLNYLLNSNVDMVDDTNDSDLENELESILSGKKATSKRIGDKANNPAKTLQADHLGQNPSKRQNVANNILDKKKASKQSDGLNFSEIEKILNFDPNKLTDEIDDDDDAVVDDTELLSELDYIVNDGSKRNDSVSAQNIDDEIVETNQPKFPIIPIFVSRTVKEVKPITNRNESNQPKLNDLSSKIDYVKKLQLENKRFALKAKAEGDIEKAKQHLRTSKQLDSVLNELNLGNDVDIMSLSSAPSHTTNVQSKVAEEKSTILDDNNPNVELNQEDVTKLFKVELKEPQTPLEALEQRLDKFRSTEQEAKSQGNSSKVRRINRIIKKYQEAIKDLKQGKTVNYEELDQMCPPGYPPIPTTTPAKTTTTPADTVVKPSVPPRPKALPPKDVANTKEPVKPKASLKRGISTTATKQLEYLQQRQLLFRKAAIEAKKKGELDQAKEYLRTAKGFDPLIEATINGLPIDSTSIPNPPQLKSDDFVIVDLPLEHGDKDTSETSNIEDDPNKKELFDKVEKELTNQIEMCIRNQEYFQKLGDITTARKFEKYSLEGKKDLNMIRVRRHNNDNIPSYKIETRTFSIVVVNTEVAVNELHVEVIKGYEYLGKPDIDTYVKVEFPFPAEKPQWKKTKTVHNSLEPDYNELLKFDIDRKCRSLVRILKRHTLKLEIYSKGTFFRSDSLIGTVNIKLNDFENKCIIHDIYLLTEGKKNKHGRLEVRVKIREPFLAKQIEEIKEKWIIFS